MGSNVHGLSSLPTQESRPFQSLWGRRLTPQAMGDGGDSILEPKCVDFFLPHFTWKSPLLTISAIQVVLYIVTVFQGSLALMPNVSVLLRFGASYGPLIQQGEVWRLVMPIFLHGSIYHILFNVFFQLRLGFSFEAFYGKWITLIVYFACGVAGNLLSVALAPCKTAVGASTAIFGFIGIQVAELIVSWRMIRSNEQAFTNIIMYLLLSLILSLNAADHIDWRGHLGGFIAGVACGFVLWRHTDEPRWIKRVGLPVALAMLAGLFASCLAVIFAIPMDRRCR